MSKLICGEKVSLLQESYSVHIFNKLKSFDQSEIIAINAETNEGFSVNEILTKSIKLSLILRKYVKKGDILAFLCENDNLVVIPLLASMFLGTTVAFINPVYKPREISHALLNLKPKFVFCSLIAVNNFMQIKNDIETIEQVILMDRISSNGLKTLSEFINSTNFDQRDIENFKPSDEKNHDDTAMILSSSGTSGVPKSVMITYGNIIAHIPHFESKDFSNLQPGYSSIILAPVFHIFGLFQVICSLRSRVKIVFIKRFKPDLFLESIQKYKITTLYIVPPLAIFLAKDPLVEKYDLSSIRDILCGAAPISEEVFHKVYKRVGTKVRQLYGLTEAGLLTCFPSDTIFKPNSSGRVGPNTEIVIRDIDSREILPRNKQGEICAKGPTIAKGYFCNDEANKNLFDSDGYLLTGDVGYFDQDGFLFIVDRIKELIKYKGFQVAPAELEGILLQHKGVKDVAVVGKPDDLAGELPTAFVVRRESIDVTAEDLAKFVAAQVSTYKQLSGGVQFIEEIPKNPGGKIIKRNLKELLERK